MVLVGTSIEYAPLLAYFNSPVISKSPGSTASTHTLYLITYSVFGYKPPIKRNFFGVLFSRLRWNINTRARARFHTLRDRPQHRLFDRDVRPIGHHRGRPVDRISRFATRPDKRSCVSIVNVSNTCVDAPSNRFTFSPKAE